MEEEHICHREWTKSREPNGQMTDEDKISLNKISFSNQKKETNKK